ncbi:hypothetical protein [Siphonobacter sp. SORGH_AS_1065]|uniref:hypothetical protein n=1 Tax=Siphonobacter sp. SORGH_AS_1065 TaxID=3041795 RepID=UPI0027D8DDBE|nr:hypothetical protein [Siphonobacter sp. SORGH_AS_1065]
MKAMKLLATALVSSLKMNSSAQTNQKTAIQNPFGLVYQGAITENVKGQGNIHPVRYQLIQVARLVWVRRKPI